MATDDRINSSSSSSSESSLAALNSELFRILGRFNDALCLAETATHVLDSMEARGTGAVLCTLVQSVMLLRAVYTDLDLTVVRLSKVTS